MIKIRNCYLWPINSARVEQVNGNNKTPFYAVKFK